MTVRRLHTRKTAIALAATLALGIAPTQDSLAAACTFIPASGNWNLAANWSCAAVPGNADVASVAAGQSATVTGVQPATSVANAGSVTIANNSSIGLRGSNTNTGVIALQSVGNLTDLTIDGLVSLNGTGSVQMSNTIANRIIGNGATLTVGAGQSILGSGQVGAGGSLALVNDGVFAATQGSPLILNTTAGVINHGALRANGGTLQVQGTTVSQSGAGVLDAINGSTVQLSNAAIVGGSFTSAGGGAVATAAGTTNSLSGVTNSGTFNLVNNSFVTLDGDLTNSGSVNLQSAGNLTDLIITGARTISGAGVINLSNTQANRIQGAGGTLTLGAGQTLQGAGTIGAGTAGFSLVNQGTVVASQSGGLLINAAGGVTNTGTLRADGGPLQLQTTINSSGGSIEARNGSQVQLLNGTVINNASFSATGAGSLITTVSGATVTLGGGTVSGPVTIANNSFVRQAGDLVYNGTLNLASAGNNTDLQIDGQRSITGVATINLSNTQTNRLLAVNGPGDRLTLGSGVTLQGAGQLGAGTALQVVNNGTVIASQGAGLLMETSGGITNNGVMRADGGPLQFRNVVVESAGGTIEAGNGSQVQLLGGTVINNANFAASGGGVITTVSGATVTLGGGTVSGPMTVANNSFLRLTADMTYNGVLSMASAGNATDIQFSGARALGGTATIELSNTLANRLIAVNVSGDSATIGSGVTVRGAGSIGAGTALAVVNNGSLIANQPAGMVLATPAGATNNALIRGDGSSFTIANTTLNQGAAGVLNAINGGSVALGNGSQVNGGSFSTASGGQIVVPGGNTARVAGVTNTGTLTISNNAFLQLNGTLTNNGQVNLQSVGNNTDLLVDGNRSITGTGTISLTNTTANRIVGASAGSSLTLGSGQTLQGAGQIGAGTAFGFTNNGTVLGNQPDALVFNSTGTVVNNGLVRADGGTVVLTGGTALGQGGAGVVSAINGGVVTITGGSAIEGGTLTTASAGQITTASGGTATLANLGNLGTVNVVNNSSLRLQGSVTNTGTVNLASVGNATNLVVAGAVTLAGSGTTALTNTLQNRIVAEAGGAQLTVGAGQTVQGAGQVGAGTALALVNQGTFTANQSTALTVAMTGPVGNAAGGLMQAIGGGTLNLDSALANAGTLAANGGVVNANAAFNGTGTALISGAGRLNVAASSSVGTLTHNGSAANGLALGASNLTVGSDYTNASAGVGNAFNRRANVTGSGQILAGGDVTQVLSGAGVSNGNTANATLTIGNVRVGANTYDVTIGNGGSTGPALRGALQTAVNGASITDARLSGSGVTASNYNAGGPAGAGEVRAITFTANSAGALAPMSGQAVNLRSTYDNIADQKLNIVLGNGAAAYNAAVGAAGTPVQLANQRVGGGNTATLSISNTAAAGAFSEDLNVSVAGTGGQATASGSIGGRLAGSGNTGIGAITVGVDASSAGAKSGAVNLAYQSAGAVNGVSNGLGVLGVGGQTVMVTGNVYQTAAGELQGSALNFGTLQVGQQISQNLVVRNTASGPAGFVEDLNASFGAAGNSQISGSGSLAGITAGSTSTGGNGTMTVTVTGSTAGALNSGIAVNYFSAGAVGGVGNGLGVVGVGSETFAVNGSISAVANVINQASPLVNTPSINLGAVRVGAAAPTAQVSVSNLATADPQAALNASIASAGAPVTASGSFSGLAPGATSTALQVGLNTAVAGNFTGANAGKATVAFVSDASNVGGCAPNCQLTLGSQDVTVSGKVYTAAAGQLATPVVDFGIVRVGDTVSARNITVSNTAATTALNDTLQASLSGVSGAFIAGTPVTGVAAQASGQISVALNTSSAGVYAQSGTVSFLSQNPDMADTGAGPDAGVHVQAQVNNLANADFDLLTGLGQLSDLGNGSFLLDLGQLTLGSSGNWLLQIDNEVGGPADALRGLFDLSGVNDFLLGGFGDVSGLEAGQAQGGLAIDFNASQLGSFQDEVTFRGFSYNASDPDGLVQDRRLLIRASVVDPNGGGGSVPEPGTLALLLVAALASRRTLRRTARH